MCQNPNFKRTSHYKIMIKHVYIDKATTFTNNILKTLLSEE